MSELLIQVDADEFHQPIDGFGVNINPTGHWRDGALRPVLDRLIDDLGASLFRLDPYGFTNWIDPDGTIGPASLHPDVYARVYRSAPFRDAWETARYLNTRGAELILNVSGVVPPWMCAADGVTLTDLDAYAELLTSLVRWAREEEKLRFRLFGPFNENDIGPPDGPFLDAAGVARASVLLAERFAGAGLDDVRLVVADEAHDSLDYVQAIAGAPRLRDVVEVIGMHLYFDAPVDAVPRFLAEHQLTHWRPWLTEYGELDQTGEMEWEAAVNSTRRLLRGLNDGMRAGIVWDAYDNFHGHDDAWTIWGIMRVARNIYTPKKRYYAARQVYRFVPPGARRVSVWGSGEESGLSLAAFRTDDGGLTVVGLLEDEGKKTVRIDTAGTVDIGRDAALYVTDPVRNGVRTMAFRLGRKMTFSLTGPTVFTMATTVTGT